MAQQAGVGCGMFTVFSSAWISGSVAFADNLLRLPACVQPHCVLSLYLKHSSERCNKCLLGTDVHVHCMVQHAEYRKISNTQCKGKMAALATDQECCNLRIALRSELRQAGDARRWKRNRSIIDPSTPSLQQSITQSKQSSCWCCMNTGTAGTHVVHYPAACAGAGRRRLCMQSLGRPKRLSRAKLWTS